MTMRDSVGAVAAGNPVDSAVVDGLVVADVADVADGAGGGGALAQDCSANTERSAKKSR